MPEENDKVPIQQQRSRKTKRYHQALRESSMESAEADTGKPDIVIIPEAQAVNPPSRLVG